MSYLYSYIYGYENDVVGSGHGFEPQQHPFTQQREFSLGRGLERHEPPVYEAVPTGHVHNGVGSEEGVQLALRCLLVEVNEGKGVTVLQLVHGEAEVAAGGVSDGKVALTAGDEGVVALGGKGWWAALCLLAGGRENGICLFAPGA